MIRILCFSTLIAASALAQNAPPDPLAALQQNATKTASDWEKLSQKLEPSIAGLLPCDPKIAAAINETSLASEARLAALAEYFQAGGQQVSRDTEAARRVLASAEALAPELATEQTDVAQEISGIEGQLADLGVSAKRRPSLNDSQNSLQQILAMARKRANLVESGLAGRSDLVAVLRNLVTAFQDREAAFKNILAAHETERVRWNAYYAARLARARMECTLVEGTKP